MDDKNPLSKLKDDEITYNNPTTKRRQEIRKRPTLEIQEILGERNEPLIVPAASILPAPPTTKQRTSIFSRSSSAKRQQQQAAAQQSETRTPIKMPPVKEKKEKKRERWLLTRKTWKYMADAGRKLIPDGVQNRPEDLPKCERHFNALCSSEQRFILWRRKASYPGALGASRHSKRRLKHLLSRSHKSAASSADEAEDNSPAGMENHRNTDQIIHMLQSYLNLADDTRKTTTLLGSKTVRPDQTNSPSAQRPTTQRITHFNDSLSGIVYNNTNISSNSNSQLLTQQQNANDTASQINELLEKLRVYSQRCGSGSRILLNVDRITPDILENKALLKQIYSELKKQQLHRILGRHTSRPPPHLPHASSLSSLWNFRRENNNSSKDGSTKGNTTNTNTTNTNTTTTNNNNTVVSFKSSGIGSILNPSVTTITGSGSSLSSAASLLCNTSGFVDLNKLSTFSGGGGGGSDGNQQLLQSTITKIPMISIKKPSVVQKLYSQLGTQTDFIHLHELQRLAKEYETRKKDEERQGMMSPTDDDSDKGGPGSGSGGGGGGSAGGPGTSSTASNAHSRRKSSIDNEDVSQSVSDTIKRYLRMARKKSVHDDNANRFKRVNYDRNLRNIRAKGEINPPGMDDGNSKQTQTLDAWPVISLCYIRGIENSKLLDEAHTDWQQSLQRRVQQKEEYENKVKQQEQEQEKKQQTSGHSSGGGGGGGGGSSNTTNSSNIQQSSSGILHTGQQFLSNLWHGHSGTSGGDHSHQPSPANSTISISSAPNESTQSGFESTLDKSKNFNKDQQSKMQKSKSSSNVGQFVSKKIWKSRSKSQTRTASPNLNKPDWTPQGNCVWMSASGKRLILTDTKLNELTEVERKILHRVAIDKINQLNIGVGVTAPADNGTDAPPVKAQKRRPLLIKRKALTTSFFDNSKNKEDKGSTTSGLMFGVTLEKCVENDQRIQKDATSLSHSSDRGSRNSIASLLGVGKVEIGSCESLPSKSISNFQNNHHQHSDDVNRSSITGVIGGVSNLINSATMKISRSQSDVRAANHEDEELNNCNLNIAAPPMVSFNRNGGHKVPAVVMACVKHLEENGLHIVGIFRVSTSKKRVRQLKEDFDRGDINTLDPETCPHDVATILKEYLRDLPEPLLCRNLYNAFVKTQKIRNRRLQLEALSHLVQLLPVAHRDTLYTLLKFLAKIVRSSDDVTSRDGTILSQGNKMDSSNLATVFAPNILRQTKSTSGQQNTTEQEIDEQIDVINVIRTMIDHYEELFRIPADLMDEVYTNMFDAFPQQLDYLCARRDIKNDDEMDSASSSTPLSSPPPILGLIQDDGSLQQVFSEFTSDNILHGQGAGLAARRIYSREDFMHENAAKGDPNAVTGNDAAAARRRERTSKMKYAESEHDLLRRRRRDRSITSADNFGAISKSSNIQIHNANINNSNNNNNNNYNVSNSSSGGRQTSSNEFHSMSTMIGNVASSSGGGTSGIIGSGNNNTQYYQHQPASRSSSNDSSTSSRIQQDPQQSSSSARRLSTPFVSHNTGVVTASLKIPVQMQQQQQKQFTEHIVDPSSTGAGGGVNRDGQLDLSDIPYIEDGNYGHDGTLWPDGRHETAITGSLSFGGNISTSGAVNRKDSSGSTSFQIPIVYDGRILNSNPTSPESIKPTAPFQHSNKTTGTGHSATTGSSGFNNNNSNRKHSTSGTAPAIENLMKKNSGENIGNRNDYYSASGTDIMCSLGNLQQQHHIEPKITASITNIGGAVLRSKTADFERMLSQNKKSKTNDTSGNGSADDFSNIIEPPQPPPRSSSTSIIIEGTTTVHQQTGGSVGRNDKNRRPSQGPIYKRQELISSAKRTSK